MVEISKEVIKAYALENAIKHAGKANQGAVLAGLFAEGLKKEEVKETIPKIKKILLEVNALSSEEQSKLSKKSEKKVSKREVREGLHELSNAEEGKVIMRFAPFPSGPLHVGNARPLVLNDEYAKMYGGKLILVMDDTIGSEDKPIEPAAYKMIEEGVHWMGANIDKQIFYKSNRIEKYYKYAEELIKKGYMYVCDCDREEMHDLKVKGVECSHRQISPEAQLGRWRNMFSAKEGSMCVRLKTNMQDPDPAFRDRVMFRISDRPHAKLGTKYRVYPLLDFSWAIDDHFLGVTHIVRGMELMMETKVEKFIWDIFGWKHPEVVHTGHFAIEGVKISKSKGAREVRSGEYIGWNDPRTWSLQSLKDRGILPESIREFILNMGTKKTNTTVPVDVLYSINKRHLEEKPRYFFVENPEKIKIHGCPELTAKIPLHPNGKLGTRGYKTKQEFLIPRQDFDLMGNENYRLMHLLNFKSDNVLRMKPREFSFISENPDNNLETKFIQWLPADGKNIPVVIRMPENDLVSGVGEPELLKLSVGDVIQFERFGFVRLHKKSKNQLEFWFAHN
jgi:glutamyl-tRNA synthetase